MFYKKNRAKCLECGDVIESESVTEYSECSCSSLKIRGGSSFLERKSLEGKYKELSVIEFPEELEFIETPTSQPPPPLPPGFRT
jgi:hypothetical protein